jgi:hypothetical protein
MPILWNYMDGFLQVSTKPGIANLLVWPPLYCFGARFPMLIGFMVAGGSLQEAVHYITHPVLTDSAIVALIVAQHLALLGGSLVFIRTLSKIPLVQFVLAFAFSSFSFLYATVQTVGSEAGSVVLILLIAAFSIEIAGSCQLSRRGWTLLSGLLCAAFLTRYINAVMLLLPVIAAGLSGLGASRGFLNAFRQAASRVLVAVAAGVSALVLAHCFIWLCCLGAKVEHRSMVGLTFLARIDQLRSVPGRFSDFVDEMVNHLRDPVLVETLQRLKRENEAHKLAGDFITEAKATAADVSRAHGLPAHGPSAAAVVDKEFNALTTATLLAQPASFRQAVGSDWLESQSWTSDHFTRCLIGGTAIDWENDPLSGKMQPLRGLATFASRSFDDLKALAKNFNGPFLADQIMVWHLLAAIFVFSIVAVRLRIAAWKTLSAVSMLVVGELLYLLSCSVAGQVCRYGIPFLELVVCGALTLLAAILDIIADRLGFGGARTSAGSVETTSASRL